MKYLSSSISLFCILFYSCQTIPPGEPPPDGILAKEINPPSNLRKEKTAQEAIDYVLTLLVSGCDPISTISGNNPPEVLNNFIASSSGKVNYVPMELWTKLIKMKLIKPVTTIDEAKYILHSEFLPSQNEEKGFTWKLKMTETISDKIIWSAQVYFLP